MSQSTNQPSDLLRICRMGQTCAQSRGAYCGGADGFSRVFAAEGSGKELADSNLLVMFWPSCS